jgi:hypothetical protein
MEQQWVTREELLADPGMANSLSQQALGTPVMPVIDDVPDDLVELPGGLIHGGQVIRKATIKELDGSDEEALSRAIKSNDPRHFLDTLINRGCVAVGHLPATPDLLNQLYIGDRNEIAIAIRNATYGDEFKLDSWTCPYCNGQSDISFNLKTDLERTRLTDPGKDGMVEVKLRKGGTAVARFPNGYDEAAFMSDANWSKAEINSEMLRRCVHTLTDAKGVTIRVQEQPSFITKLNIPDRAKIVNAIIENQPGPKFTVIEFEHEECKNRVSFALGLGDLFLELVGNL